MYRCGFCHQMSREGEVRLLVVVEKRPKEYPAERLKVNPGEWGAKKWGKSGKGWEIAQEKAMCPRCAENPQYQYLLKKDDESPVPHADREADRDLVEVVA